ncbi:serine/threonine-protein kinase [Nocardioides sp. MAHUQ-72]|uniref:serine/threonine-protein kinase n=1 Tax=unclassified Nocardioides TaxID=2615069 RepID=UPI003605B7AC
MTSLGGYPAPGEMMGSYRIGRRLGGGGMGVVFEALDTVLDRQVALKVISPHLADDPGFRARFTREAQAQASLDSPHVVHVYAHGEADGRLYIATQLVPDGDLGLMIQAHGAPPLRTAVDLIGQVAAGLADAHAAGLVHRDIKPANVLVRRREAGVAAYLGDFGIARQVDGEQTLHTTGTIGTPTYMAPELHTGGTAGVASDVYSLGCLLWATVSGTAPYSGTSDFQVVTAHLEQPVPQLEGTSALVAEVNRILRTAMAKRPEERYASAGAMRNDLRRAIALSDQPGTSPLSAAPPGRDPGARGPPSGRSRGRPRGAAGRARRRDGVRRHLRRRRPRLGRGGHADDVRPGHRRAELRDPDPGRPGLDRLRLVTGRAAGDRQLRLGAGGAGPDGRHPVRVRGPHRRRRRGARRPGAAGFLRRGPDLPRPRSRGRAGAQGGPHQCDVQLPDLRSRRLHT